MKQRPRYLLISVGVLFMQFCLYVLPSVCAFAYEVDVEAECLLYLGVAEVGDEGLGLKGEALHLVVGIADAALLFGGADEGGYLVGGSSAGTHLGSDGQEGLVVGAVEGIECRQG